MEGRLDGYIKFQNTSDSMYGYIIPGMYAIDIDCRVKSEPFRQYNYGNMNGSIEGIISHFCNEL